MAMAASAALLCVPTCSSVTNPIASQIKATKNPHWLRSTFKVSSAGRTLRRPNLEDIFFCSSYASHLTFHPNNRKLNGPSALLGGGGSGGSKDSDKKKFITKEQEPEQYWQTAAERDGVNPMLTPLPYIVILGFLTPFIILGVAFANGWVKVPVR